MDRSETQILRLGDVCLKIGSGATPRGGQSVYVDDGEYALIRSQNVYNEGFSYDGLAYIGPEHADELSNVVIEPSDILLNITGDSVARCCMVNADVLPARVNQHVSIIRPDSSVLDPRYLRYYLVSPSMQVKLLSWADSGGTRKALTKGMIESFEIDAPPLPEQRAIAHVLGTLDDKIELNRRMNETLEGMARALFKSWFVDFDPVRAKMDGRPSGLPPELDALFPDALVESALGEIPVGWEVGTIGDAVQVVGGGTPSTKNPEYWEDGRHAFCTPKDMSGLDSPALLETERLLTDAGVNKISSGQLPVGTVLMSSRAPIGYLAITEIPVSVNQGIIAMICDKSLPNLYVLNWASTSMELIEANANGSTFMEISKKNFRPIPVLVPSDEVLREFERIVRPLYLRIVEGLRESHNLVMLRDALLPKLISGELRAPVAAETLEARQ